MEQELNRFLQHAMRKDGRLVPARLQTALALLERVREFRSLNLDSHKKKGSSGLLSHETYGEAAHERLGLQPLNRNHGRRSNNVDEWGQGLLDVIANAGFADATAQLQATTIDTAQQAVALMVKGLLEQEPLQVRITSGRSVEAIITDLLKQAEEKNKTGDVAQYLVGAKLRLRLNKDIPVLPANKADRRSYQDLDPRLGDFRVANAVIEVAVGLPDDKHLTQVSGALEESDCEVWLLTRADRVPVWHAELAKVDGVELKRVVVSSVEGFIGQNITEMGEFSSDGKVTQLRKLFDIYNSVWVDKVGTPSIRVVVK